MSEFVLKRINSTETIILKIDQPYPCGRDKKNAIVCTGLTVSRKHCIFYPHATGVKVADTQSANGVYVNSEKLDQCGSMELSPNDIIGIGIEKITDTTEEEFAYRLELVIKDTREINERAHRKRKQTQNADTILNKKAKSDRVQIEDACPIAVKNVSKSAIVSSLESPVVQKSKTLNFPDNNENLDQREGFSHQPVKNRPRLSMVNESNGLKNLNKKVSQDSHNNPNPREGVCNRVADNRSKSSALCRLGSPVGLHKSKSIGSSDNNENLDQDGITNQVVTRRPRLSMFNKSKTCVGTKNKKKNIPRDSDNDSNQSGFVKNTPRTSIFRKLGSPVRKPEEAESQDVYKNSDQSGDIHNKQLPSSNIPEYNHNQNDLRLKLKNNVKHCEVMREEQSETSNKLNYDENDLRHRLKQGRAFEHVYIKYESDLGEDNDIAEYSPDEPSTSGISTTKEVERDVPTCYSQQDIIDLGDEDDNDVFRSSQLFDDAKGGYKLECKEEYNAGDVKDFFHNHDDEPDVIILSDDDDEQEETEKTNRWLSRLLGSQLELKNKKDESIVTSSANRSTADGDEHESMDAEEAVNVDIHANIIVEDFQQCKIPDIRKESKGKTKKKIIHKNTEQLLGECDSEESSELDSKNKKSYEKTKRCSVEDVQPSTSSSNYARKSTVTTKIAVPDKLSSSSDMTEGKKDIERNRNFKHLKKIPQIEPPFMPKGGRYGISCSTAVIAAISSPRSSEKSYSSSEDFTDFDISTSSNKLTEKKKREKHETKHTKDYQSMKDKKLRRLKHKFSNLLPIGNTKRSYVSREEKEEIKLDRKKRLKEIAEEKKKTDNHNTVKRLNKPRAKVSLKNRGDFLIPDDTNDLGKNSDREKLSVCAEKLTKELKIRSSDTNDKRTILQKEKNTQQKRPLENKLGIRGLSIKLTDCKIAPKQKENRVPKGETRPSTTIEVPQKKKVTFNDNVEQKFYDIEEGNSLKKCVNKDTYKVSEIYTDQLQVQNIRHPKFEEFLLRILQWLPTWLFEHQRIKYDPPVVDPNTLFPLLRSYNSYDDYYKIMSPLMALELWHGISKDFSDKRQKAKYPTVFASIVPHSISQMPIDSTQLFVTQFMVEVLVTKKDVYQQAHSNFGDLVTMVVPLIEGGKVKQYIELFAYVTRLDYYHITPSTRYNADLKLYTNNPHMLLTYTMMVKPLNVTIATNHILRMKTVSYLRSSLRMVQALQYLPQSPLLNQILKPTIEAYELPPTPCLATYPFVSTDKLNEKQQEVVAQVTDAVIQKLPRICLIQGPPGTGKSKVIVNLIREILYGSNRYQNSQRPRILVCAPSNAAIDEIALRLLAVRQELVKDRFKMVRIGRIDTMNNAVKPISVKELASRELRQHEKNISENRAREISLDSIDEEKRSLLSRIGQFETQFASPFIDTLEKQSLKRKITDLKTRYDLLTKYPLRPNLDRKEYEKRQRFVENSILAGADIITCTLSSCYTNQMEAIFGGKKDRITVCIVDEATQTTEAETLIPLMLGVSTLVLVGDPNQLPATVISQQAKKFGMDQSLFARLQSAFEGNPKDPVFVLNTQYRMSHPIATWPNNYFYDGNLRNEAKMLPLPFNFYKVLNLASKQDADKFSNTDEAIFVANLIFTIMIHSNLDKIDTTLKIGIITPYNNQRARINEKLKDRLAAVPEEIRKKVITEVNTVDSFQGQERDVIIMSCVRSNGIGFLSDRQRLCVALTRAKHTLLICGNFRTFERDAMWNNLLTDARRRGVYIDIDYRAPPEEIKKHIIR